MRVNNAEGVPEAADPAAKPPAEEERPHRYAEEDVTSKSIYIKVPKGPRAEGEVADEDVVLMYSPVGTQRVNSSRELYESEPVFKAAMDTCNEIATPLLP